jgi:hypothetical protein
MNKHQKHLSLISVLQCALASSVCASNVQISAATNERISASTRITVHEDHEAQPEHPAPAVLAVLHDAARDCVLEEHRDVQPELGE